MRDGFIRTAAATPKIKVADPVHNRETICRIIEEYEKKGAELLVFPELCLSGYTCNDLFQIFIGNALARGHLADLGTLVRIQAKLDHHAQCIASLG